MLSYGELKIPEFLLLKALLHRSSSIPASFLLVSLREFVNLSLHLILECLEAGQRLLSLMSVLYQDPFNNLPKCEVASLGSQEILQQRPHAMSGGIQR